MKSRTSKWIIATLLLAALPLPIPISPQELQNQTSTFTVLYAFPTVLKGSGPSVSFRDSAGNLYGATARGGGSSSALRLLKSSVEHNYCAYAALQSDPALTKLRGTSEFPQLLSVAKECQKKFLAERN